MAMTYYDKLAELYAEMKSEFERLNMMQSAMDKNLSNQYHLLEKAPELTVEQGYEFAKRLQDILKKRRVIKQELGLIIPVFFSLKDEMGKIEDRYTKSVRKGYELKQSLNVTMRLEDVLESIETDYLSHTGN
jgi:hypothetical protein